MSEKNYTEELRGLLKEQIQEELGSKVDELREKAAEQEETNAKLLEADKDLKAQYDALQDKKFAGSEKLGGHTYVFKGYDPQMSKNFKSTLTEEESNLIAKAYLTGRDDIFKAFDGSAVIPVKYGAAVMGLAELNSVALTYANVQATDRPSVKDPTKATRGSVDSQAPGTANKEDTPTAGQITYTIDKIVGNYIEVLNTEISDSNFDLVNTFIVPMQAEAIGQNADAEMFNKTEFTSGIVDAPATVTVSGVVNMAAAITFANLNAMFYGVEWERGPLNPMWFGSRACLKDVAGLVDTYGRMIFHQIPILGRPSQTIFGAQFVICPSISDTPANGAIRLAFGDPKHYTIYVRGGTFTSMVNPFIKAKEHTTQFICSARMDGNINDHATPGSSGAWTTMLRSDV